MRPTTQIQTRRRVTAAVIEALVEERGVDYVSVWWTARCASLISKSDMRMALGEALDLAGAMGLLDPLPGGNVARPSSPTRLICTDPDALMN